GVERVEVETALEMHEAAKRLAPASDIFIGCAAVADYRAESAAEHKIKKVEGEDELVLRLVKNPDIIATVAALPATGRPLVVGFAAETRDVEAYARGKLTRKGLDMIVANDVSQAGLGFGSDDNAALLLWRDASAAATTGGQEGRDQAGLHQETLGPQPKRELALAVVRRALACLAARPSR
ncbi:phosphopantothenoylcysteine decarboxylase, partial [Halomonas sp.]|uniref:phosphopantothenoylcysteine decarboxylase n=1 Tax=Halomonas sp. TaxID=1486246 RepID=UPI0025C31323